MKVCSIENCIKVIYIKNLCNQHYQGQWHRNNPEKAKEYGRRYYLNHVEKRKELTRQHRKNKPEEVRELYRRWYRNNTEKAKKRSRQWFKDKPEARRVYNVKRRGREKDLNDGTLTASIVREMIGATIWCPYCGKDLTRNNTHLDHMNPLSKGGTHSAYNIIPCCSQCNRKKGARLF